MKTCNSGMTKCMYLNVTEVTSDLKNGHCNKYKESLIYDPNKLNFKQLNYCKGIAVSSAIPDNPNPPLEPKKPSETLAEIMNDVVQPAPEKCYDCGEYIQDQEGKSFLGNIYHVRCLHGLKEKIKLDEPPEQPLSSASSFLIKADDTMKQRGKTYDKQNDGKSERSMGKTVRAFNELTGSNLSEAEGWLFMILLKQARQWSTHEYHEDSALDSVAYSSLLAEALANES